MAAVLDADIQVVSGPAVSGARRACRDLTEGLKRWRVWTALAWQDIRIRYIRTKLGPLWITVSMAIFVVAMGIVFTAVFKTDLHSYLPFLTAGLVVWGLISGVLTESATTFTQMQPVILSVSAPYSIHIFRAVLRQAIIFGHNLLVYVGVILVIGVPVGWVTLLFFPGLVLVCVTLAWINLLIALIGIRFRDLQPIISSFLQLIFLLTPLIWDRNIISGHLYSVWIDANPIYHLVEVMRAPLLGRAPSWLSVVSVVAMAVVGWVLTYAFFARFRRRVPYWL